MVEYRVLQTEERNEEVSYTAYGIQSLVNGQPVRGFRISQRIEHPRKSWWRCAIRQEWHYVISEISLKIGWQNK